MTDLPRLTPTERAVFLRIMEGLDNDAIADAMGCSVWTVRIHVAAIREKLGGTGCGQRWWIAVGRAYERTRRAPTTCASS